jgi:PhnB protein
MASIHSYLTFKGNCEEAFTFYKSVFGGDFVNLSRFSEMPPVEGMEIPAELKEKLMHVSLPIGENSVLMGSDEAAGMGPGVVTGNNISLSITADNREQTDELFSKLSKGGSVSMPLADTFWGSYFGQCTDRYGINWMISFDAEPAK